MEKEIWDENDAWEIALEFDSLTADKAWKRADWKHGVDFDDLFQEGRIAVFQMARRCEERQTIVAYIDEGLRWRIAEFANRLRRRHGTVSLDWDEADRNKSADREAEDGDEAPGLGPLEQASCDREYERRRMELADAIRGLLTAKELTALRGRLAGLTEREIAKRMGVSQPMVAKLLKNIRKKLLPVLRGVRQGI